MKTILSYLDAFEHICDPIEQFRLMQVITDVIGQRPKLDLNDAFYFRESYIAETDSVKTHGKLIKDIVQLQMSEERKENNSIREYLQTAYKLTNQYVNKQWTDTNQEDLKKEIKQRQFI